MKKKIITILILVAITTINQSVNAQARIGGNIGLAIPNGAYSDGSGSGLGINGRLLFPISENFSLGGNIGYHTAADYSFIPITIAGEYLFSEDDIQPYIGLDLGIYKYSYTVETPDFSSGWYTPTYSSSTVSDSNVGWALHGGIYMNIGDNLDFNADVKYNTVSAGDGLVLKYIDLSVGLFFKL